MPYETTMTRRQALMTGAGLAAALALPVGCSPPAEARALSVLTFPGTYNLLIRAAEAQGFFSDARLDVARDPTTTSMYLIEQVNSGTYPIGASSVDNVVAYNEGQGQVELDRPPDLFAFMNIQRNMRFPLVTQADYASTSDLAGARLAVDAVSTGFSFVLREILGAHGLEPEDYELVSVGNARDRLEALKAGDYAGAILTPPFDAQAEAAGLKILATSAEVFDDYQGTAFITTRRWAAENEDTLVDYTRAMLRALAWIRDPANTDAAAALLAANIDGMPEERARGAVAGLRDGLSADFNMAGIRTVLDLRSRYGRPRKTLDTPSDYIDTRYLQAARASLQDPAASQ